MTTGRAWLLAALVMGAQSAAVVAQSLTQPPSGASLVDCRLARINFETMKPEDEKHRFVILLGAPQGRGHAIDDPEQLQVFDPSDLLMGRVLESAQYSERPATLVARTDTDQGVFFRFAVSMESTSGALGMNGRGSEQEHMAHSYMGDCTISAPADAAGRFEALRTGQ